MGFRESSSVSCGWHRASSTVLLLVCAGTTEAGTAGNDSCGARQAAETLQGLQTRQQGVPPFQSVTRPLAWCMAVCPQPPHAADPHPAAAAFACSGRPSSSSCNDLSANTASRSPKAVISSRCDLPFERCCCSRARPVAVPRQHEARCSTPGSSCRQAGLADKPASVATAAADRPCLVQPHPPPTLKRHRCLLCCSLCALHVCNDNTHAPAVTAGVH